MYEWSALGLAAAAGLGAWGAVHPRSQLFGPSVCGAGQACALTFDDGPNPAVTPHLLSVLDKYGVRATFFVLGKYVEENRSLTAEIAARNHVIGNHTHTHPNLLFYSRGRILDELNRCEDAIFNAAGRRSSCVRPPFGFRGPQFFAAASLAGVPKVVMWSVSARDWNPQSWEKVSRRIGALKRGDIALMHDGDHRTANAGRSHTVQALLYWLPRWKDAGLEFTAAGADSGMLK